MVINWRPWMPNEVQVKQSHVVIIYGQLYGTALDEIFFLFNIFLKIF